MSPSFAPHPQKRCFAPKKTLLRSPPRKQTDCIPPPEHHPRSDLKQQVGSHGILGVGRGMGYGTQRVLAQLRARAHRARWGAGAGPRTPAFAALLFWANIISGKSGAELKSGLSPPQLLRRQQKASDKCLGAGRSPAGGWKHWEGCPYAGAPARWLT